MASKPGHHVVCAVAYDGLCTFEFGIAVESFALARPEFDFPWYDFKVVSGDPSPLHAAGGFTLVPPYGLETLGDADTIIIPGWRGADAPVPDDLVDSIRTAHERGCRLVSICSGAFVLAATGLLDGRVATTHWRYTSELARQYPAISVNPDVLYMDAGNRIYSSAGSAAGADLCLHLIRLDHGADIANSVARRFVLPTHRDGGQQQFIERPIAPSHNNLGPLLDVLRSRLTDAIAISEIAQLAGMSQRTLVRHFNQTTGLSPQNWLIFERIKLAKELLESSQANISAIASSCGFATPETFRHHFRRHTGISPSQHRRSFHRQLAGQ